MYITVTAPPEVEASRCTLQMGCDCGASRLTGGLQVGGFQTGTR